MITSKRCGRKQSWSNLKYYAGIYLEGLGKPRKPSVRIAGFRLIQLVLLVRKPEGKSTLGRQKRI
jgi:hypothetical protein